MTKEIWCPLEDMKKERLWYAIVTRDRYGKIVARERRKSRSFLKAWNEQVFTHMRGTGHDINITDTGGAVRLAGPHATNFRMNAALGITNYGIRVGTGNTPVAIDDFALETPCDEGVGAGEMEHLVCTVDTSVVGAPSCAFEVHRTIANNSGGVITVREAAIYMGLEGTWYSCGIRDILTVPQAVPDGGAITIDWTIGVTV